MKNTKYYTNSAFFFLILFLTIFSTASLAIRNYDNDPDLAAALEYDSAEATDRKKVNRELAEKHYLEYLKKDIPSFQKARVYLILGSLFTVGSDPQNGIMPDREKGDMYLAKVLELEPERIDLATIRARTLWASSLTISREESLQRKLDVYEWLSSLNEEKFQKLWLPLEPDQQAILPITLKSLKNYVPRAKRVEAVNLVTLANEMPDREARLAEIIGRFPDTEIAEMARKKLNSQLEVVADEAAMSLLSSVNDVTVDTKDTVTVDKTDTATVDTADTPVTSTPNKESFSPVVSSGRPKVAISIGFLGFCFIAGVLVWTWRKKRHVNS